MTKNDSPESFSPNGKASWEEQEKTKHIRIFSAMADLAASRDVLLGTVGFCFVVADINVELKKRFADDSLKSFERNLVGSSILSDLKKVQESDAFGFALEEAIMHSMARRFFSHTPLSRVDIVQAVTALDGARDQGLSLAREAILTVKGVLPLEIDMKDAQKKINFEHVHSEADAILMTCDVFLSNRKRKSDTPTL